MLLDPNSRAVQRFLDLIEAKMAEPVPERRGRKPRFEPLSSDYHRLQAAEALVGKLCQLCGLPYPESRIKAVRVTAERAWNREVAADPELRALLG